MTGIKVVAPHSLPNLPRLSRRAYSNLRIRSATDIHAEIALSKLIASKKAYHDAILLVNNDYADSKEVLPWDLPWEKD